MKKIFVIDCHPRRLSFSQSLFEQYIKGSQDAGHEVKSMRLSEMDFEIDLAQHNDDADLEPSIVEFQQKIIWSEHVMLVFPLWWGFMPAKMKGLIDRAFLPQFAYAYEAGSALPKKLLKGRSVDVLVTSDTPNWYFKWLYKAGAFKIMRMQIFEFVGFKPARFKMISSLRNSSEKMRLQWLEKAWKWGNQV